MIGHECRLSRTNANGVVWVCQCGAIGDVVPMHAVNVGATERLATLLEITEGIARAQHRRHLDAVRADIARASDRELARIGGLITKANELFQRRGRWGNP